MSTFGYLLAKRRGICNVCGLMALALLAFGCGSNSRAITGPPSEATLNALSATPDAGLSADKRAENAGAKHKDKKDKDEGDDGKGKGDRDKDDDHKHKDKGGAGSALLRGAAGFAVFAASTITSTGPSVVNGDMGLTPGSSVTGFPPGTLNGTLHINDAAATQAKLDLQAAYNDLAGRACGTNLTGQDLGGMTLAPGVYCFNSSAELTGALTLDAQGNSNAVFVIQIGSTLTTASNSSVTLINGASAGNVFWQVGSSATLGTNTAFQGTIIAYASITVTTGSSISNGRAMALNGAVTLDSNSITNPGGGGSGSHGGNRDGDDDGDGDHDGKGGHDDKGGHDRKGDKK